jgi:L-ribulose-5-phosphate 3-epimerase UlaE
MKIGATSFAFRYLLLDPTRAPRLEVVVERAHGLALDCLQICENARPLDVPGGEWEAFLERAHSLGMGIQLGCKTLDPSILERYLKLASGISSRTLRVVLEDEDGPPTQERIDGFLGPAARLAETYRMRLAIENHFDLPVRQLIAAVSPFPSDLLGFCVDAANSLRRFEPVEYVFDSLGPRAYCYHLKDFKVSGSNVGFAVTGAPLGQGDLNLDWVLDYIRRAQSEPEIYLEAWVPSTGVWERDVQTDWEWLSQSLGTLRNRVLHW